MFNKSDFKIGKKFYCVYEDSRDRPEYVTVSKVGRKYISFEDSYSYVYNLEKGFIEMKGYGFRGYLYATEDEYIERKKIAVFLNEISDLTKYSKPHNSKETYDKLRNRIKNSNVNE